MVRTHFAKRKGSRKRPNTRRPHVQRKRGRGTLMKSRQGTFRKRMRGGMTFQKDCGLPSVATPPPGPHLTAPNQTLVRQVLERIIPVPYGVTGTQKGNSGDTLVSDVKAFNDFLSSSVVVDAAGPDFFGKNYPEGAGGVSEAIYQQLGIVRKESGGGNVKGETEIDKEVLHTLNKNDAAIAHYYPNREIIHVYGPDGRTEQYTDENVFQKKLSEQYKKVFELFIHTQRSDMRMPPISSGIFAGLHKGNMPRITWKAVTTALSNMTDEQLQKLLTVDRYETTLNLCIYLPDEFDLYRNAKEAYLSSLPTTLPSVAQVLADPITVDNTWCKFPTILIAKPDFSSEKQKVLTTTLLHRENDLYAYEPNVNLNGNNLTVEDVDDSTDFNAGYAAIFSTVSRMPTKPDVVKLHMLGQSVPDSIPSNFIALNRNFNDFAHNNPATQVVLCVKDDKLRKECEAIKTILDEKIATICVGPFSVFGPFSEFPKLIGGKRKVKALF